MKKQILGITGGIGSGKSEVLRILQEEYGAEVIKADIVAHELMEPGQEVYRQVIAAFGREILHPDGRIDRSLLGRLVFGREEKRQLLNRLTHPAVKQEILRRIVDSRTAFLVIEAALLLEEHYEEICGEIWYVYADRETRFARLADSRGYTRKRAQAIMDRQLSEDDWRKRCQATVDNSGSLEQLRTELARLLQERGFAARFD